MIVSELGGYVKGIIPVFSLDKDLHEVGTAKGETCCLRIRVQNEELYVGGKRRYITPQAVKPGERAVDRPGSVADKAPVVSVLQRGGHVWSMHAERVTAANLKPIINQMVDESAHLMTDSSTVLRGALPGRRHSQVNHHAKEYVRVEDGVTITTNTVEGYFSILKRGINGIYHHVGKQHLGQYLREFDYRYNIRELNDLDRSVLAIKKTSGKRLMLKDPKSAKKV